MLKKLLFMAVVLAIASASFGQPNLGIIYHEVEVVDEEGVRVTDITSVDIYLPDTTTNATIYKNPGAVGAITIPMTTTSTNTTLSNGTFYWWGPSDYDFSITDGTNTHTNYGFRNRTPAEGKITFPSYLHAASTTTFADAVSITMGTSSDWVINAGATADLITFTPASDGAVFRVGLAAGTKSADLQWYTASGVGLLISESANTIGITGLTTNINVSSNYTTNINTGTSTGDVNIQSGTGTGAVTIGSAASGVWAIDGTSTGTINCDAAMGITTTDASADITIDSTAGSVKIDGGEAAVDAVTIVSAGGMDISLVDDFDFALVSGAADENMSFVLSGATASSIIITSSGTGTDAIDINTSAGGIDIDISGGAASEDFSVTTDTSITMTATENAAQTIHLQENAGSSGTITLYANQGTSTTEKAASIQLLSDVGSIELWSGLNGGDAVNIMVDGDTASGITIFNDTGTGDESILVSTDVGGITVEAKAGSIDIEATGAEAGDIILNAGDDMTLTVAGDLTLAVTGSTVLPADVLLKTTTALTHDHMDNLAATQKELVAAVAGSTIEFVSAIFALDYGTTAWTEASAPDDLCIRYTDGDGAIVSELLDATGFATATEDTVLFLAPTSDIQAGTTGAVAVTEAASTNKALVLDNTGAEWTNSGDSQVVVIVYYRLHTTAELGL